MVTVTATADDPEEEVDLGWGLDFHGYSWLVPAGHTPSAPPNAKDHRRKNEHSASPFGVIAIEIAIAIEIEIEIEIEKA